MSFIPVFILYIHFYIFIYYLQCISSIIRNFLINVNCNSKTFNLHFTKYFMNPKRKIKLFNRDHFIVFYLNLNFFFFFSFLEYYVNMLYRIKDMSFFFCFFF